jgi:hypothetical protein
MRTLETKKTILGFERRLLKNSANKNLKVIGHIRGGHLEDIDDETLAQRT